VTRRLPIDASIGDSLEKESVPLAECASSPAPSFPIPVLLPRLPSAARLMPFLHLIDQRRCYTNYGPLSTRFESEIGRHIGCAANTIVTAASGTAAITAALLALDLPAGSICLMPSWTFAATPHAALAAGMTPRFHDVDPRTWALNAQAVSETVAGNSFPARAVVLVAPFGAPLDLTAWENFQKKTGIAVIVDAAAGFDTVRASSLVSVVSLHATKIFAAGEGGFVVAPTPEMRNRVMACCNFGFQASRVADRKAINAKMSEYHAAVGLANFDGWPATRLRHLQITRWYRQAIGRRHGISLQPSYGDGWVSGTTNVLLDSRSAESISSHLLEQGIESRRWWSQGCHVQPAFAEYSHGELSVTENLATRVLGLPHFPDMKKSDVEAVVRGLSNACRIESGRVC
jgi:dTDP-4-amino-4,6-dideoxygalactose transaminase